MPITEAARLNLLSPPAGRVRVVLDTDTYNEIDDQFAIVQMLLSPDRFDVEAIYAAPFFNVVVWLGGHALEWPDTIEFNLKQDVGGAQVLLDSGVPLVLVPCRGVTSHLHSTVPEIERYVEPHGSIGAFLAMRFKEYSADHLGWAKEIWDMAPVGWLLNPVWAPSVIVPAPILTDQMTWSIDRRRHAMRYVTSINRNAILRDFFLKLAAFAALPR